ncbi:MAG TPA: NUDIX hydrolase [Steroidobacteraceae bacterium]|nr:NUDIX hydrolase [Steroidobacteraceae bacterium]
MSNPEITVAAVVEAGNRFLVVEERIESRLVINQPAGHVERGETLLEAVVREVREETAWLFTAKELVGVYLWRHPGTGRTTKRFTFSGVVTDHRDGQPLDDGIVGTHWLTLAELEGREQQLRSPLVLRCLEDYLAGRCQPLAAAAALDLDSALAVAAVGVA